MELDIFQYRNYSKTLKLECIDVTSTIWASEYKEFLNQSMSPRDLQKFNDIVLDLFPGENLFKSGEFVIANANRTLDVILFSINVGSLEEIVELVCKFILKFQNFEISKLPLHMAPSIINSF